MLPRILDKSFSVRGGNNFTSRARDRAAASLALSYPSLRNVRFFRRDRRWKRNLSGSGKTPPSDFLDLSCFSVDKTGGDATWHLTYMVKSRFISRNGETFCYFPPDRLRDKGVCEEATQSLCYSLLRYEIGS